MGLLVYIVTTIECRLSGRWTELTKNAPRVVVNHGGNKACHRSFPKCRCNQESCQPPRQAPYKSKKETKSTKNLLSLVDIRSTVPLRARVAARASPIAI